MPIMTALEATRQPMKTSETGDSWAYGRGLRNGALGDQGALGLGWDEGIWGWVVWSCRVWSI